MSGADMASASRASAGAARRTVTFVTGNANKLREVRQILASPPPADAADADADAAADATAPFELVSRELDVDEVQGTTRDVARHKCRQAAALLAAAATTTSGAAGGGGAGTATLTEDTALCFDALGGLPGPYIKHFLGALGLEGLNKMLAGFEDKSATAVCTFAYCASADSEPVLFEGRTRGRVVMPRGENRFGWDPIMEVEGTGKTYAEMTAEEKNALSHRYKALSKLREYLCSPDALPKADA